LDIDGTLARNNRTISENTQKTLIEAQQCGLRIVVASGRPTYGIKPVADLLRLDEYGGFVLAYNGGEIWNWQEQSQIYKHPLPDDSLPIIYKLCKDFHFDLMTYCGDSIITEVTNSPYITLSSQRNNMKLQVVSDFLSGIQYPIFKCMIVGEPDRLESFQEVMNNALSGIAVAFRSEPFYLEIVPQGIDKAACLKHILSYLNFDRNTLVACGDGYNDISMIRYAGLGVAMGNANSSVKQSADYITLSNEADGVAFLVKNVLHLL